MSTTSKYDLRKIIITSVWVILAAGTIYLQLAASKKRDAMLCKGVEIEIKGVNNHFFIDRNDVLAIIKKVAGGKVESKPVSSLDLSRIEREIRKDIWIRDAELYVDNNGMLMVEIDEREPVARIFTVQGATYYIDSSLMMLPLSEKFSARVPVFTNFPSETKVLHRRDSILLRYIADMSGHIHDDPFLMGMIDQVDIRDYNFEFIPKIGNQVIIFGDGTEMDKKFDRLKLFYKEVMAKAGWNYYSQVNVSYRNQVVAKRRDAADIVADSLRTMQLLRLIAERAERMAEDSLMQAKADKEFADSTMILQSLQRDEISEGEAIEIPSTVVTTPVQTTEVSVPVAEKKPGVKADPQPRKAIEGKPVLKTPVKNQKERPKAEPKPAKTFRQEGVNNDY